MNPNLQSSYKMQQNHKQNYNKKDLNTINSPNTNPQGLNMNPSMNQMMQNISGQAQSNNN